MRRIPMAGGLECDCFSRKARRILKLSRGDTRFAKKKYGKRLRKTMNLEAQREAQHVS